MDKNLQDTNLVVHPLPNKRPLPEKALQALSVLGWFITVPALAATLYLIVAGAMFMLMSRNLFLEMYGYVVNWPELSATLMTALVVLALSLWVAIHASRNRTKFYGDVLQGRILELTTRGGVDSPMQWCVVVEGNNLMNQLRTQTRPVNAGDWHKGVYVVGGYADFSKTSAD